MGRKKPLLDGSCVTINEAIRQQDWRVLNETINETIYQMLKNGPIYCLGHRIVVTPDRPKMQLSERVKEVLTPAQIADHNAWMLEFFGTDNLLNDGAYYPVDYDDAGNPMMLMNPRTYARMVEAAKLRCAF